MLFYSPAAGAVIAAAYLRLSENPASSCAVIHENGEGGSRLCSGNIVGRDKLLTAAHCAPEPDETAIIRCSDQRERLVQGYLIHPLYHPSKDFDYAGFDLALLQAESDFAAPPARLPKKGEAALLIERGVCSIFGYGLNSSGGAGELLGAPVIASLNSSFFFQTAVFTNGGGGSAMGRGDSGGGLFCRSSKAGGPDSWIQTAALSQIANFPDGSEIGTAALLSESVLEWIIRNIDRDFPLAPNFTPTVALQTAPADSMEPPEECLLRLTKEAICHSRLSAEALADEIRWQCGITAPLPVLLKNQTEEALCRKQKRSHAPLIAHYRAAREDAAAREAMIDRILDGDRGLPQAAAGLKRGQSVQVSKHYWAKPALKDDECSIQHGALTIIGFDPSGETALARNHPAERPGGARCPDGALLLFKAQDLASLEKAWQNEKAMLAAKAAIIDRILDGDRGLPQAAAGLKRGQSVQVSKHYWTRLARKEKICSIKQWSFNHYWLRSLRQGGFGAKPSRRAARGRALP